MLVLFLKCKKASYLMIGWMSFMVHTCFVTDQVPLIYGCFVGLSLGILDVLMYWIYTGIELIWNLEQVGEVDPKPRWYSVLPADTSSGSVSSKLINTKTEFSLGKRFESTAAASESSDPPSEKYEYQAEVGFSNSVFSSCHESAIRYYKLMMLLL